MDQCDFRSLIGQLCEQTIWSSWQPLRGCWLGQNLPSRGGIYRIRVSDSPDLLYIGETGNIKKRMGMLQPIYDDEKMPYRSPHVAGPHLWALRKTTETPFEVSIAPLDSDEHERKGLEYLAIALYRQQFGRSPAANFGRMVQGWRASSSNNARLAARGLRYRGGPTVVSDESHLPGIAPLATLLPADPTSSVWGGHHWSAWRDISLADPGTVQGLYRLRRFPQEILYIGQGQIAKRLKGYRKLDMECSWVAGFWFYHQHLELICDLIASYVLAYAALPPAQFGASEQDEEIRGDQPLSPDRGWWMAVMANIWRGSFALSPQDQFVAS